MSKLRLFGIILSSSALSLGLLSSTVSAAPTVNEQHKKVQIQSASTEKAFSKNDLIKRFHELFPKQFDFLTTSDFQMSNAHYFPNDETVRYDLSFSKVIDSKRVNGYVGFIGEDLEIENFSYSPPNVADALFPAKVSKEEARKIAEEFVKKFHDGAEYQLETNEFNYYPQRLLTEPINYSFSFARTKNQVSISDQRIGVSVLGNGEIVSLYRNPIKKETATFDDSKKVKDKNEMLKKVKDNLVVDLQYQINMDYQTGKRSVQLVYQPRIGLYGVHALTGNWYTTNGYSEEFPKKTKIEKLSPSQLPAKHNGVTLEQAKKIAEQFLKVDSDKGKLVIQSMVEIENYLGEDVISISYMYEKANGGFGSSLDINKQTGEVIQYYNFTNDVIERTEDKPKASSLTHEEALAKAIKYLKEWAPSYLHNYAKPIDEAYFEERTGTYNFSFPRIVNGVIVAGDQINVSIAADGTLNSLNVNYQKIEDWPAIDKVISEEDAKVILKDSLSLKLQYIKTDRNEEKNHYELVYSPMFNEDSFSVLDANTGKWNNMYTRESSNVISHPWAEEELNYLINAKVLDIKDPKKFNGDAAVSKGEALKVMMNSLTYFYEGMYMTEEENKSQTFDNIGPKHPLYSVVERAVSMGIIKPKSKSFDFDSPVTREELSAWYIRTLDLEQAAKNSDIFKLGFVDAAKVQAEYTGYVAIANSLGILEAEQNNFYPGREVTYAELAVSTIRLAHIISEKGRGIYY